MTVAGPIFAGSVILSVWLPLWSHYHVAQPVLDADIIRQSATEEPSDALLQEVSSLKHRLVPPIGPDVVDAVSVANALISDNAGRQSLFEPRLLAGLNYAGFETLWVLLSAYEQSGDLIYLEQARLFLLDFIVFENTALLPQGRLWNDHATAVRPVALSRFWHFYRDSELFEEATARLVLEYAMVTATRLADAAHYTFGTNHGTMQNLGLLHLRLTFPELPGMLQFADLAISRQTEQLAYMFGPEGAWRENSAGYHRLGLEITSIFLRYMTLAGVEIPPDMRSIYKAAYEYYATVRSPDGSLPAIGDTSKSTVHEEPLTTSLDAAGHALPLRRVPPEPTLKPQQLFAELRQLLWSSGDARQEQLVLTWSNSRRFGHKHADELSLNLRNRDGRWWTSVGYWPLTDALRSEAQSWAGSNAPHLSGESGLSSRHSALQAYSWSERLAAAELRREGPDGFGVRRLVVFVEPSLWLVVDAFEDRLERSARIVWGSDHDVGIHEGSTKRSYRLTRAGSASFMSVSVLTPKEHSPQLLNGSVKPFAGWVELDYDTVPASAIVVNVPSKSGWSAIVSRLHYDQGETSARMIEWSDVNNWQVEIDTDGATLQVLRKEGDLAVVQGAQESQLMLRKTTAPADSDGLVGVLFDKAAATYGERFNDLVPFRWKLSILLGALLLGHLALLLILWLTRREFVVPLSVTAIACWSLAGALLHYLFPLGLR